MTGTIQINKINLLGYTPETQVYFIQNAGGNGSLDVCNFLQAHRKFFQLTLHCGQHYYALPAARLAKFRQYATSKGFKIVEGLIHGFPVPRE